MSRCIAINKNNNICRAKLTDGNLFCCKNHYPINSDIVEDGCFMCTEKIEKISDIMYLKCRHAFHKSCYEEWLKFSTYQNPICLICRSEVLKNKGEFHFKPKYKEVDLESFSKISKIMDILKTN